MPLNLLSHAEQVATHLRTELLKGRWSGTMPGVLKLELELAVNRTTIDAALKQLEDEGLLVPQGKGRGRKIVTPPHAAGSPSLRVGILLYEETDTTDPDIVQLQHLLLQAGHTVVIPPKTQLELGREAGRIARCTRRLDVDAWIVLAGSQEILEAFATGTVPAFALFGRLRNIPIAGIGPDVRPANREMVRCLAELGHRWVVMLSREERRKPHPGIVEKAFLDELATHGLPSGGYNLPDWEDSPAGLHAVLHELFRLTPPTAIILGDGLLAIATMQFCSERGLRIPGDLSLACCDRDPAKGWSAPSFAHLTWDALPWFRRILRWTENVARKKDDRRQSFSKARFANGGTVGPATGSQ